MTIYDHSTLSVSVVQVTTGKVLYKTEQDLTEPLTKKMFARVESAARRHGKKLGDKVTVRPGWVGEFDIIKDGEVIDRLLITGRGKESDEQHKESVDNWRNLSLRNLPCPPETSRNRSK